MLRNLKKMLALLVALQMLFSYMPVTALAGPNMVETQSGGQLLSGTTYATGDADQVIYVGDTLPLTMSEKQSWSTSDPKVATVSPTWNNETTTVTGIAPGVVTITSKRFGRTTGTWVIEVKALVDVDPTGVSISGVKEMVAYTTTQLRAVYEPEGAAPASVTWKSSNDEVLKVDSTGLVTAMKPGTASITVTATDQNGNDISSEPHEIVVSRATESTNNSVNFFYLKTPTSDPTSNNVDQWGRTLGTGSVNLNNAEWNGINSYSDVANRVISWPDGATGTSYTVPKDTTSGSHWMTIYNAFKSTVDGITSVDDVEAIVLHPYKISDNADGYHVDCTVEIRAKNVYTATYWLWDAGSSGYAWKAAANYHKGDTTAPAYFDAVNNQPTTKTVNGVTYTFVGWYTDEGRTGSPVSFPYTIGTANVNFYAKYVAGYNVIYDLDGGTWNISTTYPENEDTRVYVKTEKPTKPGYTFDGWENNDDDVTISNGSFIMPNHNVTLKAKWVENSSVKIHYVS